MLHANGGDVTVMACPKDHSRVMSQNSAPAEERPAPAIAPKRYRAMVIALYAVAVGLRLARYACGRLSGENALIGSTAEEFLHGNFPFFLLGKNFFGTYDAMLSAPLIFLFGPSSYILNLWPPLFSLIVMVVVHRALIRVLDPPGVLAGLAFMAVPPSLWLLYSGYAQTHYSLDVVLSALLLLQTVRLSQAPRWSAGQAFWWGLAAGAGLYTNPQTVCVFLACAAFLLVTAWRRVRPLNLAAFCGGGLLGGLPVLCYYALHDLTYKKQLASVFGWHYLPPNLKAFLFNSLPIIVGFNTKISGDELFVGSPRFWAYAAVAMLMAVGMGALSWRGLRGRPREAALPPLVAAVNLAVLLFSVYGLALASYRQAYLLPWYLALPFCWGLAASWAARWRTWALWACLALIIGVSVSGYPRYTYHGLPLFLPPSRQYAENQLCQEQARQLRQAGVAGLYALDSWLIGYYTDGDPLAVHPWAARKPMHAHHVDAMADPLFYGDFLADAPGLLGLAHKTAPVAGQPGRWGFAQPDKGRLLERRNWRAASLDGLDLRRALNDNDLATGFQTPANAAPDQGFVLDLGAAHAITGVGLIPADHAQTPAGLRIEASIDGVGYCTLAQAAHYRGPFYVSGPHPFLRLFHGRVESWWPARSIRYLRFTHLGPARHPWSVREVLLWGPAGPGQRATDWAQTADELTRVVAALKPKRVYADAWAAAVLRLRLDHEPWISLSQPYDNTGAQTMELGHWPRLDPAPGTVVVLEAAEAPAARLGLERWGFIFEERRAGRLVAFNLLGQRLGPRIEPAAVSSASDPRRAAALTGAGPGDGPWSSGGPQNQGGALVIDLGLSQPVRWLELHCPSAYKDFARGLAARASDDGHTWRVVEITPAGPLAFSGQALLAQSGAVTAYHLENGLKARYLELSLDTGEPRWWWSVEKLILRAPPRPDRATRRQVPPNNPQVVAIR
ncbi:hypothetical protein [Desulfarculus baarsii]|nr:hypothetical protein [Desulfarculus baarsii]